MPYNTHDAKTFNERLHFTRHLLTRWFQYQLDVREEAVEAVMKWISGYLKKYIERDPAFNFSYKNEIIKELTTNHEFFKEVGPREKALLLDILTQMQEIEDHVGEAMIWVNRFKHQPHEFDVFNEAANTAESLDAMRDKMQDALKKSELIYEIGRFVDTLEFRNIALIGGHQTILALEVINVFTEQASALPPHATLDVPLILAQQTLRCVEEIGAAALSKNWTGLGIALLDLVEPFVNSKILCPFILEKVINFLDRAPVRARFNDSYTGHTLDEVDEMFHRISRVFHSIAEDSKSQESCVKADHREPLQHYRNELNGLTPPTCFPQYDAAYCVPPTSHIESTHALIEPSGASKAPLRLLADTLQQEKKPPLSIDLAGVVERQVRHDARTGAPIYRMNFFPPERPALTDGKNLSPIPQKPIGSVDLYGAPIVCRSVDGSRTNMMNPQGVIASQLPAPKVIEAICVALPPTLLESAEIGIKMGMEQGLLSGVTNVLGRAVCSKSSSKKVIQTVQILLYNSFYFTLRCQAHLAEGQPLEATLYDAAIETGQMFVASTAGKMVSAIGKEADKRFAFSKLGTALSYLGKGGPLLYSAYHRGVVDTGAYLLGAVPMQDFVEGVGDSIVNSLRK